MEDNLNKQQKDLAVKAITGCVSAIRQVHALSLIHI